MKELQVIERAAGWASGKACGVLVLHASGNLSAQAIGAARAALLRGVPAVGYLQVFPPLEGAPAAAGREREAWSALAEQMKTHTRAGALVVLQGGFGGAALRAAISGVMLISRGRTPTRVFATLDEGARYLLSERAVDEGTRVEDLVAAARALSAEARPLP